MKILLDECMPRKTKKLLDEHEVNTVPEMGFNGLKDGPLLAASEQAEFDILLTLDKNIDYQVQNVKKFKISIEILDVLRSTLKYIEPLIPRFKSQIHTFEKGEPYRIKQGD